MLRVVARQKRWGHESADGWQFVQTCLQKQHDRKSHNTATLSSFRYESCSFFFANKVNIVQLVYMKKDYSFLQLSPVV